MKYYWKISLLLGMTCLFFGCQDSNETKNTDRTEIKNNQNLNITVDMLTTNKDLSCGMILKNEMIADTAIYKDQLYGFCCDHCKNEFKKDPESFITKLEAE